MEDENLKAPIGKNLLIEVPDVDLEKPGSQPSYIRLGKFSTDDVDPDNTARGGDLVASVKTVAVGDGTGPDGHLFEDDWRDRGAAPGHTLTTDERKALSDALIDSTTPSFGWRDHTEGNRITTTRGDKIEVIGGNYKLVVLGRSPDASTSSGLDFSGGQVQDFDAAPGTVNEIRWVQDYDGTWKVFEHAEKGVVYSLFHGDVTEEYYGKNLVTTVGSENGTKSVPGTAGEAKMSAASMSPNPTIVEKTWATSITSSTGSAANRVPTITESTHANNLTETTDVSVKLTESVTATALSSTTTVAGTLEESVTAGIVMSKMNTPMMVETTEVAGLWVEKVAASFHFIFEASIGVLEITGGFKTSISLAGTAELTMGAATELLIGVKSEFEMGPETHWAIQKTDTELQATVTKLAEVSTKLTSTENTLNEVINVLSSTQNSTVRQIRAGILTLGL